MAGAKGLTSVFAILDSKVTTAVKSRSAAITAVTTDSVRWVATVYVILTGQGTDAILRRAMTFKDARVADTVAKMLPVLVNLGGLE